MAGKREKPEDIVTKLRQVEVLHGQGLSMADAVRQIGISQHTFYRWRKQYGGMNRAQLSRLKDLEKENLRLRRAVSDLTLEKLILTEAAQDEGRQANHPVGSVALTPLWRSKSRNCDHQAASGKSLATKSISFSTPVLQLSN